MCQYVVTENIGEQQITNVKLMYLLDLFWLNRILFSLSTSVYDFDYCKESLMTEIFFFLITTTTYAA